MQQMSLTEAVAISMGGDLPPHATVQHHTFLEKLRTESSGNWGPWHTGGGCWSIRHDLAGGLFALFTDGECDFPTESEWLFGIQSDDDGELLLLSNERHTLDQAIAVFDAYSETHVEPDGATVPEPVLERLCENRLSRDDARLLLLHELRADRPCNETIERLRATIVQPQDQHPVMNDEKAGDISGHLLNTAEVFADTCSALEPHRIKFGAMQQGENPTVRMLSLTVDGTPFLMICKRGG